MTSSSPSSPASLAGLWPRTGFWVLVVLGLTGFAAAYLYTTGLWEFLLLKTEPTKHYALTREQIIGFLGPQFWRTSGCLLGLALCVAGLYVLGRRGWSETEEAATTRFSRLALLLAAIGLVWGTWLSWGFELDDKWITYRTSRNILQTGLPVWNLGELVNLSTSFVWPYLCTLGHLFGDWNTVVKLIGFGFVLGTAWLAWRYIPLKNYAAFGAMGVTLFYPLVLWSFGGLETALAAFYLSLCVLLFLSRDGRSLTALALMGGMLFVRPDLVLVGAGALGFLLLTRESLGYKIKAILAYAMPVGAFLGFHQCIFSVPFPRPFYMKGLRKTSSVSYGYLNEIFTGTIHLNAALTIFFAAVAVAVVALFAFWRARRSPNLPFWGVVFGLLLHVGYTHICGYQHMAFTFRYYVPTVAAGFLVLVFGLAKLRQSAPPARFERHFLAGLLVFQAALFVFTAYQGQRRSLGLTRCVLRDNFSLNSYADWMMPWIESGRYLTSIAKPGETLFTWANMVGPSVSTVYTIDQFYMPFALSSRPEIAGFAKPGSDRFEKFTYVLTSPDTPEVLAEKFPNHYVLKSYYNLLIMRQKPAPNTAQPPLVQP